MDLGRVFVAGSINMDVVATADRHPQGRRDRRRQGRALFSRRQGREPGGRRGQARRANHADRPAWQGHFRAGIEGVSRGAGRRPHFRQGTPRRIPEPRSSPSPMPTTPSSSCPAPTRWSSADDVAAPVLAKGDIAVSQFEIPLPTIGAFFKRARAAGATTILNPAPAIAVRRGVARSRRHTHPQRNRTRLAHQDRASRHRRSRALHRGARSSANGPEQDRLRDARQARRAGADRGRTTDHSGRAVKAVDTTGAGDCFVGAVAAQLAGGKSIRDALRLRQHRRLDLRAADGRCALDADGGGGRSRRRTGEHSDP